MSILPRLFEDRARAVHAQRITVGSDLHLNPVKGVPEQGKQLLGLKRNHIWKSSCLLKKQGRPKGRPGKIAT